MSGNTATDCALECIEILSRELARVDPGNEVLSEVAAKLRVQALLMEPGVEPE